MGNLTLKTGIDKEGSEWERGDWAYNWLANGMLKSVQRPDGSLVEFEYDALGRRTAKIADGVVHRYVWDGNVLLHEWSYEVKDRPKLVVQEDGELVYDRKEVVTSDLITWVYDQDSFTPNAKIVNGIHYSIINDYLGTPIEAYDDGGKKVWNRELDCYGEVRKGDNRFVPFLYQGQYWDEETGLAYNRFRYYDPVSGGYMSQDPIGLKGGVALYAYVHDTNALLDPVGLSPVPDFVTLKDMAAKSLDFSTAKDGAVFWSSNDKTSNMRIAQDWARANGKTTLEQTAGGRYLESLDLFNPKNGLTGSEAAQVWDVASKRFADGASGKVYVFSTGAKRIGPYGERTWWRIEQKSLRGNKNVSEIIRMRKNGTRVKGYH